MNPIPYGKQSITEEDIRAVEEVLRSDYLTQGPKLREFEEAFAKYVGSRYAVGVANGTAALHLSAMALNIKPGDKVITTPITFAATANCVRYCGGEVVFADIDPQTYLLDIEKVRQLLEAAPMGTYKGIIPVDFAGRAVDMEAFRGLADEYDLWLLEDACHAPGGYFVDSQGQKQHCGNGAFAELAIFSFHPVKHIAAGEGGMITTNNPELCERLQLLRTHGITKKPQYFQNSIYTALGHVEGDERGKPNDKHQTTNEYPGWYMEMQELGYNYRLSELHAALGLSQLSRADENLKRRREVAKKYDEVFRVQPWISRHTGVVDGHAYHLYVIEVENRVELFNFLRENNILVQIHYLPCHLMPYYQSNGWENENMSFAENYYSSCLSLPMYHGLTEREQDFVVSKLKQFFDA